MLIFECVLESNRISFVHIFRYCFLIPKVAPDGRRMVYFALKQSDPSYYHCDNTIRMWVKVLMALIMEIGICPGYTIIYDLKGYTFAHMAAITISTMKNYVIFSQVRIYLNTYMFFSNNSLNHIELL